MEQFYMKTMDLASQKLCKPSPPELVISPTASAAPLIAPVGRLFREGAKACLGERYSELLAAACREHIELLHPPPSRQDIDSFKKLDLGWLRRNGKWPVAVKRRIQRYVHDHNLYEVSHSVDQRFPRLIKCVITAADLPITKLVIEDVSIRCRELIRASIGAWMNRGLLISDKNGRKIKCTTLEMLWAGGVKNRQKPTDDSFEDYTDFPDYLFKFSPCSKENNPTKKRTLDSCGEMNGAKKSRLSLASDQRDDDTEDCIVVSENYQRSKNQFQPINKKTREPSSVSKPTLPASHATECTIPSPEAPEGKFPSTTSSFADSASSGKSYISRKGSFSASVSSSSLLSDEPTILESSCGNDNNSSRPPTLEMHGSISKHPLGDSLELSRHEKDSIIKTASPGDHAPLHCLSGTEKLPQSSIIHGSPISEGLERCRTTSVSSILEKAREPLELVDYIEAGSLHGIIRALRSDDVHPDGWDSGDALCSKAPKKIEELSNKIVDLTSETSVKDSLYSTALPNHSKELVLPIPASFNTNLPRKATNSYVEQNHSSYVNPQTAIDCASCIGYRLAQDNQQHKEHRVSSFENSLKNTLTCESKYPISNKIPLGTSFPDRIGSEVGEARVNIRPASGVSGKVELMLPELPRALGLSGSVNLPCSSVQVPTLISNDSSISEHENSRSAYTQSLPVLQSPNLPDELQNFQPPDVRFTYNHRTEHSLEPGSFSSLMVAFNKSVSLVLNTPVPASCIIGHVMYRTLPQFYMWYSQISELPLDEVPLLSFTLLDVDWHVDRGHPTFFLPQNDTDIFTALKQGVWYFFWAARCMKKDTTVFRILVKSCAPESPLRYGDPRFPRWTPASFLGNKVYNLSSQISSRADISSPDNSPLIIDLTKASPHDCSASPREVSQPLRSTEPRLALPDTTDPRVNSLTGEISPGQSPFTDVPLSGDLSITFTPPPLCTPERARRTRTKEEKKRLRDLAIALTSTRRDIVWDNEEVTNPTAAVRRKKMVAGGGIVDRFSGPGTLMIMEKVRVKIIPTTNQPLDRYEMFILSEGQVCEIHGNMAVLFYKSHPTATSNHIVEYIKGHFQASGVVWSLCEDTSAMNPGPPQSILKSSPKSPQESNVTNTPSAPGMSSSVKITYSAQNVGAVAQRSQQRKRRYSPCPSKVVDDRPVGPSSLEAHRPPYKRLSLSSPSSLRQTTSTYKYKSIGTQSTTGHVKSTACQTESMTPSMLPKPEVIFRLQISPSGKFSPPHPKTILRSKTTSTNFFRWFACLANYRSLIFTSHLTSPISFTSDIQRNYSGYREIPDKLKFTLKDAMPGPSNMVVDRGNIDQFLKIRVDIKKQYDKAMEWCPEMREFEVLITVPGWEE